MLGGCFFTVVCYLKNGYNIPMKQLGLPFRRSYWKPFFKVVLITVGVALIATILMYFFVKLRNDDIVQYFPKDTEFFISFKLDDTVLGSTFFNRLQLPSEIKQEIKSLTKNNLNQKAERNIGFGLIPVENELLPVSIIFLDQEIDANHPLLSLIAQHDLAASKIDNPIYNKHYVILANEKRAVDAIARVIENQLPSLNDALQFNIQRQFISQEKGLIYIAESYMSKITQAFNTNDGSTMPMKQKIVAGFDIKRDAVHIYTEKYNADADILLPSPTEEVSFAVSAHQPGQSFGEFIQNPDIKFERINNLSLGEISNKYSISRATYGIFDQNRNFIILKTEDRSSLKTYIEEWLVESLANTRKKEVRRYLPDGSSIVTIEKDRESIYADDQGRVHDDVTGDVFYQFSFQDEMLVITKNIPQKDFEFEGDTGCSYNASADLLLVDNEYLEKVPYIGEVVKRAIFSTYPQGYPQIYVCLQ